MPARTRKQTAATATQEAPEMSAPTVDAPAFDIAALAESVQESEQEIVRVRRTEPKYANNPFRAHVAKSLDDGKTMELPVPAAAVKPVVAYLRAAAKEQGHGISINHPNPIPEDGTVTVQFRSKPARENAGSKTTCPVCGKPAAVTADGKVRAHGPRDARCAGSGQNAQSDTVTGQE